MPFDPDVAAIRFGCGLSPVIPAAPSAAAMIEDLRQPDVIAERFPIESFSRYGRHLKQAAQIRAKARKKGNKDMVQGQILELRKGAVNDSLLWQVNNLLRWTWSEQPLRERMTMFWADHFTAKGKVALIVPAVLPYIEEAVRPNISGSFADLLIAATTHPLMLHFLDQSRSVGPNSAAAAQAKRLDGLNENLAREVMELHTLGVNGPYSQADVRQLAELFTGLSFRIDGSFVFRQKYAEPGTETVLGKTYGGDPARLEPVHQALRDLAMHPATAQHIASKLAVHFVGDAPDPVLIDHVTARYLETGGDLLAVYGALLEHPAAWQDGMRNVKPPFDFVASACRALAVMPDHMQALRPGDIRRSLQRPIRAMGQPLFAPDGPDGWPEADAAWITPQAVSARLRWALAGPAVLRPDLPDPVGFVDTTLGPYATQTVRFAAGAAESQADAIGLVLAAPAFQRR